MGGEGNECPRYSGECGVCQGGCGRREAGGSSWIWQIMHIVHDIKSDYFGVGPGKEVGVVDFVVAEFDGCGVEEEAGGGRDGGQFDAPAHGMALEGVVLDVPVFAVTVSEADQCESGLLEAAQDDVPFGFSQHSLRTHQRCRLTSPFPLSLQDLSLQLYFPHVFSGLLGPLGHHCGFILFEESMLDLRPVFPACPRGLLNVEVEGDDLLHLLLLLGQHGHLPTQTLQVLRVLIVTILIEGGVLGQLLQGDHFGLQAGELGSDFPCAEGDPCVLVGVEGIVEELGLEVDQEHNKISACMRAAHHKLSLSTACPLPLPPLKFYSQRPIHEELSPPSRQVPITFVRYVQNKHKRRYHSKTEPALPLAMHESLLITNCLGGEGDERGDVGEGEAQRRFAGLVEKVGRAVRQREERSSVVLSYYKRKFLKYRCRKSIDLNVTRTDIFPKSHTPNSHTPHPLLHCQGSLLSDGLKIEKIGFAQMAPRVTKEIVPRAKFNTISDDRQLRARRWQIGPWGVQPLLCE